MITKLKLIYNYLFVFSITVIYKDLRYKHGNGLTSGLTSVDKTATVKLLKFLSTKHLLVISCPAIDNDLVEECGSSTALFYRISVKVCWSD